MSFLLLTLVSIYGINRAAELEKCLMRDLLYFQFRKCLTFETCSTYIWVHSFFRRLDPKYIRGEFIL